MPVKDALAEAGAAGQGEGLSYTKLAEKHGVVRSTLTRQLKGKSASKKDQALKQRLLHPHNEAEVLQYIRELTKRHLMPTRQMIINFVTPLCA